MNSPILADQPPVASRSLDHWTWFCVILPCIALGPLLYTQAYLLMQKQHMQFAPLAIAAAVYFLVEPAAGSERVRTSRWKILVPAAIVGLVIAALALMSNSSWLAHVAIVFLVWIWAIGRIQHQSLLRISGICGLIAVTIPPPLGMDHKLIQALQWISSSLCSGLMDIFHIVHLRRGNILEIPSKTLFVEEACSGVDSQYALMAVAGALLLLGRAGLIVSLITIVTVPIWAIFGNLLRIFSIVVGLEWFGVDLASGTVHLLLGLVTFGAAAWAHWSSVQLLNFFELKIAGNNPAPIGVEEYSRAASHRSRTLATQPISTAWLALPGLLLLLAPSSYLNLFKNDADERIPSISSEIADRFPDSKVLGTNCAPLQYQGFLSQHRNRGDMLGEHSRVWRFKGAEGDHTASLDFLFRGWHPLWECYISAGWSRESTLALDDNQSTNEFAFPFYESILRNQDGESAVLHFSLFDQFGKPYTYEGSFDDRSVKTFYKRIVSAFGQTTEKRKEPLTLQFQLLTQTGEVPTDSQLQQLRSTYLQMRARVLANSVPVLGEIR